MKRGRIVHFIRQSAFVRRLCRQCRRNFSEHHHKSATCRDRIRPRERLAHVRFLRRNLRLLRPTVRHRLVERELGRKQRRTRRPAYLIHKPHPAPIRRVRLSRISLKHNVTALQPHRLFCGSTPTHSGVRTVSPHRLQ